MYIAILGRQPAIGMAELEQTFGNVSWFSDQSAIVDAQSFNIERLGGTQKAGSIVTQLPAGDWRRASMKLVQAYTQAWADFDGKITLGISAYGFNASAREIQKTGIILKGKLKEKGTSLRLIPNTEAALNTATSHHNKLGLSNNKVELIVVRARNGKIVIAESIGAQNITSLARRDQERPKRDAFVGMLPPKLAQIVINLTGVEQLRNERYATTATDASFSSPATATAVGADSDSNEVSRRDTSQPKDLTVGHAGERLTVLDPFCGTGVIPQEVMLLGYNTYGTDLADKMIDYSRINLDWLMTVNQLKTSYKVEQGDAMDATWQQPIDAVACETYLGQPFSAPPSPSKLTEVRGNCNNIISAFLTNIASQLQPGTPLCVAVPAWRDGNGDFTHLPLIGNLDRLGFERHQFKNVRDSELLYYREDQIVARELLVLKKV